MIFTGKHLMYLRKSELDRDFEDLSVEETLNRHLKILTEFCTVNRINVAITLKEVVSAESLYSRPKMLEALELINTGEFAGIVCMDLDRLSRGSNMDSGYITEVLKANNCKIVTPPKTYDLNNESDEQFTDMKFMFSRYELKTITNRLVTGRNVSASEGKFLGSIPPYGYEPYKLKGIKGNSLRIIPEEAEVVRMIFRMYSEGTGYNTIAYQLNEMHVPSRHTQWKQSSIFNIINNEVYIGKIRWKKEVQKKIMVDGKLTKKRYLNHDYELHDGLHEPIIDQELWDKAKEIQRTRFNDSTPIKRELKNPFADLIICRKCGSRIKRNVPDKTKPTLKPWYRCSGGGRICDCSKMDQEQVETLIIESMKEWLKEYTITVKPKITPQTNDVGVALQLVQDQLKSLHEQQEKICDLLEKGVYTIELFSKRNSALEEQITELKKNESDLLAVMKDQSKNQEKQDLIIPTTQHLLDSYDRLTIKEKNQLWKQVLDHAEIYKHGRDGDLEVHIFPKI